MKECGEIKTLYIVNGNKKSHNCCAKHSGDSLEKLNRSSNSTSKDMYLKELKAGTQTDTSVPTVTSGYSQQPKGETTKMTSHR